MTKKTNVSFLVEKRKQLVAEQFRIDVYETFGVDVYTRTMNFYKLAQITETEFCLAWKRCITRLTPQNNFFDQPLDVLAEILKFFFEDLKLKLALRGAISFDEENYLSMYEYVIQDAALKSSLRGRGHERELEKASVNIFH